MMSLKHSTLEDGKYLFETLYKLFNMEEHAQNMRNQRVNSATLRHATLVDRQLIQYSRQHGHSKTLKL